MKPSTFLRAFVFAVIIVGVLPGLALAQGATVADATFMDANWSLTVFPAGNGGSVGASQTTISGNPLRSVNDTVNGTPSVILAPTFTRRSPTTLPYWGRYDRQLFRKCDLPVGVLSRWAVYRASPAGGRHPYIYNVTLVTGPGTRSRLALTALAAASFSQVAVTTTGLFNDVHPDFSSNGAPIQFGFFRATVRPEAGYSLVGGIDTGGHRYCRRPAAPLPRRRHTALGPMAISGLGLLLGWRGSRTLVDEVRSEQRGRVMSGSHLVGRLACCTVEARVPCVRCFVRNTVGAALGKR